ncbi:hypothetical protein TNCV_3067941 [Trichonephila clavipes]|nr:hypothetical protein TNCV_3067941 [Trichonephila clavipes]
MFKVIESPAKCEMWSVIHFLTARNMSAANIHRHVTGVYGIEAISDSKVQNGSGSLKMNEQISMTENAQAGPL